jgi:carbon-monoxide dehydrogenase large subunit
VPAFSNAVNDAFAKLGGVHTQMPHTPPRVWTYAKGLGLVA